MLFVFSSIFFIAVAKTLAADRQFHEHDIPSLDDSFESLSQYKDFCAIFQDENGEPQHDHMFENQYTSLDTESAYCTNQAPWYSSQTGSHGMMQGLFSHVEALPTISSMQELGRQQRDSPESHYPSGDILANNLIFDPGQIDMSQIQKEGCSSVPMSFISHEPDQNIHRPTDESVAHTTSPLSHENSSTSLNLYWQAAKEACLDEILVNRLVHLAEISAPSARARLMRHIDEHIRKILLSADPEDQKIAMIMLDCPLKTEIFTQSEKHTLEHHYFLRRNGQPYKRASKALKRGLQILPKEVKCQIRNLYPKSLADYRWIEAVLREGYTDYNAKECSVRSDQ